MIIEDRVRNGATFLDANVVGWVNRIDTKLLDLSDCCGHCILHQLFGDYMRGAVKLDIIREPGGLEQRSDLGLTLLADDPAQFFELTAAWRRLILARRAERFASPALTAAGETEHR